MADTNNNTTTKARWALRVIGLVAFVLIPGASVALAAYAAYTRWSN